VVSRTTTLKVASPIFPDLSADLHVTLVLPIGKVEPDAGEQRGINELSTLSVAITLYVIMVPAVLAASITESFGTNNFGGEVSKGEESLLG
jgi:hypothetical protein